MNKYQSTIGLEIHVQLKTKSKMFCSCDNNAEGKAPNTVVCPICMGYPGTLPVPNRQAIEYVVKLGRYLNGEIANATKFDRKHYFYPDLPKGYQISQYDMPIVKGGYIIINDKKLRIERIHLEEDTGKLIHDSKTNSSLVDLNRAGTPLMEIVTKPVIKSPAQAKAFMQKLRTIVRHLGISSGDMEKGHLRCDANISVIQSQISPAHIAVQSAAGGNLKTQNNGVALPHLSPITNHQSPIAKLGTPVEIKNLNSFLMVEKSLNYEIERQSKILDNGEKITKETRGWNDAKGVTIPQRNKETAPDYRYFPEPDIPPIKDLDKLEIDLPEHIDQKIEKVKNAGIKPSDINTIFKSEDLINIFDQLTEKQLNSAEIQLAVPLMINISIVKKLPVSFIIDLVGAIASKKINQVKARQLISLAAKEDLNFNQALEASGYTNQSSAYSVEEWVNAAISENEQAVNDYHRGKANAIGFLVGQVMRISKGQADPNKVTKILKQKL